MTLPVSDGGALGQLLAILDAQVSRLDAIAGNGGVAETKAGEAVDAATAWGAREHVRAAEEVRKDIAEANAAVRQCMERYEAASTRARSLEQGGDSGRSTVSPSGSSVSSARLSADGGGRHRKPSVTRWRSHGRHRRADAKNAVTVKRKLPDKPTPEAVTVGLSGLSTAAAGVSEILPTHAQTAVNVVIAAGGTATAFAAWRSKRKETKDADRPGH